MVEPLLFLGIAVLVMGVAAAFAWNRLRRDIARWKEMGDALLYRMVGPAPSKAWMPDFRPLHGSAGGFDVFVRTFTTGSGRSEQRWTSIEVPMPGADPAFEMWLTREGLGDRMAKAFGG